MSLPFVAIVGRPNVGKSALFNKLIGKRLSIVEDTPGVTRDRIYSECNWLDRRFMLIDTGGIEPDISESLLDTHKEILAQMRRQAQIAIEKADVIIFLTDIQSGVTANDYAVCEMLQKSGKPVILTVNKVDGIGEAPLELYEFFNLGIGDPMPVSSVHGHGTGDLLDEIMRLLDEQGAYDTIGSDECDEDLVKVAIIGKPNAGKSSLVNTICGEERSIVTEVAGTTRDSVDSPVTNEYGSFVLIDTAGIRKNSKITEKIEHYSVLRAFLAVDRADVCVIMIDAEIGFTEQDSKIAGYAHEQGKASIVCVNKWDVIEKETSTMADYTEKLKKDFAFMSYVPFVFISAKTGDRINTLFEQIKYVYEQNARRISTGVLNEVLAYSTTRVQPPSDKGKRLKIFYITQPSVKPPTFVIFVNSQELFHFSYQRYIENQIRTAFDLSGTPIRFIIRERDVKDI